MRADRRPLILACVLALGKALGCGAEPASGRGAVVATGGASAGGKPQIIPSVTGGVSNPSGGAPSGGALSGGAPSGGAAPGTGGAANGGPDASVHPPPPDGGTGAGGAGGEPPPGPFRIDSTTILAPLVGQLATPAAGQEKVAFYASDLGYTFVHEKNLRILLGDTWTDSKGGVADPAADDSQGTISLSAFPRGDAVDAYVMAHPPAKGALSWQRAGPPIDLALGTDGRISPITVNRDGNALNMGTFRAPVAGFSNGDNGAFAIFNRTISTQCSGGTSPKCPTGLTCDTGMGSCTGVTTEDAAPCVLGTTRCICLPIAAGGMCQDRSSSVYDTTEDGRLQSVALTVEVANADPKSPTRYYSQSWATNKFYNPAAVTVSDFDPARSEGNGDDYRVATQVGGSAEKVFLWGRPGYVGAGGKGRDIELYFAYVDMPKYDGSGHFAWTPHYFTGVASGVPKFSDDQSAAVALDLSDGMADPGERFDIVNQMTVSWVAPLKQWVMLYGGDLPPLVITYFLGAGAGDAVRDPDGAIHARFAAHPWGPWSKPISVLKGGDPATSPPVAGTQYGPGGILYHPACTSSDCAPTDPTTGMGDFGRLYASIVVDAWTEARGPNAADIYWNVSTWNPYGIVLMKSRIAR